ncbi:MULTISPECIES: ABC transporter ATP-binding protein [Ferrimonas]|uniref:ABC transporter ATP-binding protein n=1 Tax=Ferrimonas TaxID=44011 RepID=UPI0003F8D083|nr:MULTISPECIES: ABC transporter ATP-binding protein [Ferrimonas]USD38324.1 ABC transporter ATP-binding protein [Ferrimonas sp. SCSIO 43195]
MLIHAQQLSKSYGSKLALDRVDLSLDGSDSIALVGPNGAGKTTLMSLICGYLQPSSGSLTVLGHAPGSSELLGQLSALPQDAQLDPGFSIGIQLRHFGALQGMSKTEADKEARRVLELVQLADTFASRPQDLSHGMRKRVTIAQALMGQPRLVLLDEPTAGLDPANARAVRDLVNSLRGQCHFLISSHNLEELQKMCDTVLHIEQGRISQTLEVHGSQKDAILTLTLTPQSGTEADHWLRQLPGVREVTHKGQQEFLLRYDDSAHPQFDIELLQALHRQQLEYRQLSRGLSLEDRLFN